MGTMSTLQIGLLIIGAILVIAVWGYNLWQEKKIRRRMDDAFKNEAELAPEPAPRSDMRERIEPAMTSTAKGGRGGSGGGYGSDGPATFAGSDAPPIPIEPITIEAPPDEAAPLANEPVGGELPDPDIECVARLQAVQPIPGVVLMDAVEHRYAKPCRWVGRQITGTWTSVRDAESYTEVAACLALADRSGALPEQGYKVFRQVIEELAQALPAAYVIGERDDELKRAASLDAFCAEVDVQIGLNLMRTF